MTKDSGYISKQKFMQELRRYQRGSVTRRHFLGVTGLGTATAVLGVAMPTLRPAPARAATDIGDRVANVRLVAIARPFDLGVAVGEAERVLDHCAIGAVLQRRHEDQEGCGECES